jgi:hypothetical protein
MRIYFSGRRRLRVEGRRVEGRRAALERTGGMSQPASAQLPTLNFAVFSLAFAEVETVRCVFSFFKILNTQ